MGNKIFKRIMSIVMVLAMILSLPLQSVSVQAAETKGYEFGTAKTVLQPGTYNLPVNLQNATNKKPSMAKGAIAGAKLRVEADGTATVTLNVQPVTVGPTSSQVKDWTIYSEYNYEDETATIPCTTTTKESESGESIIDTVSFVLPDNSWDGVYLNLYIEAMQKNVQSFLAMDFQNTQLIEAQEAPSYTFGSNETVIMPGKYSVPISLRKENNHGSKSMAASAFPAAADLIITEEGKAIIETTVSPVTVVSISDWAENIQVFKEDNTTSETFPATILELSEESTEERVIPSKISFEVPDNSWDGVYLSFWVNTMNNTSNGWLNIDYANYSKEEEPTIFHGSAEVEQFGTYTVKTDVSVADGVISDVAVHVDEYNGTHKDINKMKVEKAAEALKNTWNGIEPTQDNAELIYKKIMKEDQPDEVIDAVSGATYSAKAVRDAVMNAFELQYEEEVINVPESVEPGVYEVEIGYYSDVVYHSLVENTKAKAILTVNNDKTMTLEFDTLSGTAKEPLYLLDINGIYTDNDLEKELTMDGVEYEKGLSSNDYSDQYFAKGTQVVNHLKFPLLGGLNKIYNTNCYMYVPAMNNLNGELEGVQFENGYFNVDAFAKIYWDGMKKIGDVPEETPEVSPLKNLENGVYQLQGSILKTDKKNASMADSAINHTIGLKVADGKYSLIMTFKGMEFSGQTGYLGKLEYFNTGYTQTESGVPQGTVSDVVINSYQTNEDGSRLSDSFGTDYMKEVTFEMIPEAIEDQFVPLQIFVPVMDTIMQGMGTQQVYLKLDADTLERVEEKVEIKGKDEWIFSNGKWWYRHADGSYTQNNWEKIDGKWYHFDANGWMQTDWQLINGAWYFFNVSGTMLTDWQWINGVWYYFTENGNMVTGWQAINGAWYFFDASGAMVTGWQAINGAWYFFNASGVMLTDWQWINGVWYHFAENGIMATGWQTINGTWYFFDVSGAMLTGWQMIYGNWYFFDASGAMLTDWHFINGAWYYFTGSGDMATGWQLINGTWYYLDDTGAMLTGWQMIYGNWYFFDASGAMAVNQWIGGYYVNESGVWMQ